LTNSQITSLNNLEYVKGSLFLEDSPIISLGKLKYVGSNISLMNCRNIKSLGNLEQVGWSLDLENSSVESLGNLKHVDDDLWVVGSPLTQKYTESQIRYQVSVGGRVILNPDKNQTW